MSPLHYHPPGGGGFFSREISYRQAGLASELLLQCSVRGYIWIRQFLMDHTGVELPLLIWPFYTRSDFLLLNCITLLHLQDHFIFLVQGSSCSISSLANKCKLPSDPLFHPHQNKDANKQTDNHVCVMHLNSLSMSPNPKRRPFYRLS